MDHQLNAYVKAFQETEHICYDLERIASEHTRQLCSK